MKPFRLVRILAVCAVALCASAPVWAQEAGTAAPTAPVIEPAAKDLLAGVDKRMQSIGSLSFQTLTTYSTEKFTYRQSGYVKALRPNYLRAVSDVMEQKSGKWTASGYKVVDASDGKTLFSLAGKTYSQEKAAPDGTKLTPYNLPFLYGFFQQRDSFAALAARYENTKELTGLRLAPKETLNGVSCDVVQIDFQHNSAPVRYLVYISPDELVHRVVQDIQNNEGQILRLDYQLSNLKVNPPLTAAQFTYTPPKTARPHGEPKPSVSPAP